jgi:aspartate kinase
VFEIFEKYRTPIDMITTSEVAVSVTIDNATALNDIKKELEALGTVDVDGGQSIVSIVGNELASDHGVLKKLFQSLDGIEVRMVSYGGSAHNVSILIDSAQKSAVLQQLNSGLFGL